MFRFFLVLAFVCLAHAEECQGNGCAIHVNSMLQSTARANSFRPQGWDLEQENLTTSTGPTILFDGKNEMTTKFVHLTGKFAEEYFYSVDPLEFGIQVNDTHAVIPMGRRIQFNFIRRWHATGDEHVGVVNQKFGENSVEILPKSLLADDIVVGLAEKMHVYSTLKKQDTSSYRHAMESLRTSDGEGNKSDDFYQRNTLTIIASSLSMPPLELWKTVGGASQDIMNFSNDGEVPPPSFAESASNLRVEMDQKFAQLRQDGTNFSDPEIEATNCYHFGSDIPFDADQNLIYFPLDTKINSYRGNQVAVPYVSMSIVQGVSVFSYNTERKMLEVYLGVAKESTVGDPYVENPTGYIALAPASGTGDPIPKPVSQNQSQSTRGDIAYHTFQLRDANYKADWEFLFKPYTEICPDDHLEQIGTWYEDLSSRPDAMGGGEVYMSPATAKIWLDIVQCSTNFLRPARKPSLTDEQGSYSAQFNEYMSMAAMHGLLEVPKRQVMDIFMARDWQDINVSLIPGAE